MSDDESVYGGGDAKSMRLRAAERNKARKEALKHKSRMVATGLRVLQTCSPTPILFGTTRGRW